jgi:hypothetical protein
MAPVSQPSMATPTRLALKSLPSTFTPGAEPSRKTRPVPARFVSKVLPVIDPWRMPSITRPTFDADWVWKWIWFRSIVTLPPEIPPSHAAMATPLKSSSKVLFVTWAPPCAIVSGPVNVLPLMTAWLPSNCAGPRRVESLRVVSLQQLVTKPLPKSRCCKTTPSARKTLTSLATGARPNAGSPRRVIALSIRMVPLLGSLTTAPGSTWMTSPGWAAW